MSRRLAIALAATIAVVTTAVLSIGTMARLRDRNRNRPAAIDKMDVLPVIRLVAKPPARKTLQRAMVEPGRLEAFEQTAIYVKLMAYVEDYRMDIGDSGETGQLMAKLWIPELDEEVRQKEAQLGQAQASVAQATAAVAAARAAVQTAQAGIEEAKAGMVRAQGKFERWESEHRRIADLAKSGTVDRQMADETKNELTATEAARGEAKARVAAADAVFIERKAGVVKADADLVAAQAAVKNAEADLARLTAMRQYTKILMPYAGVVVQRNVNRGDLVLPANTGGKPLFVVARTDIIRAFVDAPEADSPWIKVGVKGSVIVQSLGGRTIEGSVTRTSRALGPNRTLLVELDLPNPEDTLVPGMYVVVRIMLESRHNAITLPISALVREEAGTFCYCVEHGQPARRRIQLGLQTDSEAEVVSGLSGDEMIIQSPGELDKTDQRIEIVQSPDNPSDKE